MPPAAVAAQLYSATGTLSPSWTWRLVASLPFRPLHTAATADRRRRVL